MESYVIPRYSRDHFAHYMQICEWYLDINNYKDQLLAFHVDRSRHYHRWLGERRKGMVATSTHEGVEEY